MLSVSGTAPIAHKIDRAAIFQRFDCARRGVFDHFNEAIAEGGEGCLRFRDARTELIRVGVAHAVKF